MAAILDGPPSCAEDIEHRFCDPETVKIISARHFTFLSTDPLSTITPWKEILEATANTDDVKPDGLFDLPEQKIIDEDCQKFISKSEIPEEQKEQKLLVLRKIITIYSKSEKETYASGNGWIHLLGRLISLDDSALKIYTSFKNIRDTYVPTPGTHEFILKLLLRYHDPSFYSWINNHGISLNQCTASWFDSLFAKNCTKQVCDYLWESFINCQDSFRIFFISLSIILVRKSNLTMMETNAKEEIEDTIGLFPNFLSTKDLIDVLESTKKLDITTPPFFREAFVSFMFGDERSPIPRWLPLVLPLSMISMLENLQDVRLPNIVFDFFIVDCRPSNQYEGGHFSFKYKHHVECNTLFKSAAGTIEEIELLMTKIKEAENIEKDNELHICLIGNSVITNDPCVRLVAKELLKRNRKYVSMLYGGCKIIHDTLKAREIFDTYVIDHNQQKCLACSPMRKKMTPRLKKDCMRSEKNLLDTSDPMNEESGENSENIEYIFNVSDLKDTSVDKNSISRTGTPASFENDIHGVANLNFSSKDENNNLQGNSEFKIVLKNEWQTLPDVIEFRCKEISSTGDELDSLLLLTNRKLVHLRMIDNVKDQAYLIVDCHITLVVNIRGSSTDDRLMTISFDTTYIDGESAIERGTIPYEAIMYLLYEKEEFVKAFTERYYKLKV